MSLQDVKSNEPDTMSGVYEELLESMEEVVLWAKGEKTLKATTISRNEVVVRSSAPQTTKASPKTRKKAEPAATKS